jgi:2-phosphosulfolactate phosphatase
MAQKPDTMRLDVYFSPLLVKPEMLRQSVVAVIDVLRASTSICTALHNGARGIVPFAGIVDAQSYCAELEPAQRENALLCGERHSVKPEGFHLGNSPLEYTREAVAGKMLLFTTTNGTKALEVTRGARFQCVAGFVNAQYAAAWMLAQAVQAHCNRIALVCAGSEGGFSYEDTLCAGLMVHRLQNSEPTLGRSDAAKAAQNLYAHHADQLDEAVCATEHAQSLAALGFEGDVRAALAHNSMDVVPVLHEGRLADGVQPDWHE